MKVPSSEEGVTLHALFPTLVYQVRLPEHDRWKHAFESVRGDFDFAPGVRGSARYNAGEYHGRILLHQCEALRPFFSALAGSLRGYLAAMGMRPEFFAMQCLKSWFVQCDPDPETEHSMVPHNHSCSDVSWVYYLDVPDACPPITFHAGSRPPAAIFESAFHYDWHDDTKSAVNTINWWNSETWSIHPSAGDLLLFPGRLVHSVDTNSSGASRISIAGDIALTLHAEHKNLEFGRTDPTHWLTVPL